MGLLNSLMRLYYTVKPLRLEQIWYRARYKLRPLRKLNIPVYRAGNRTWRWQGFEISNQSYFGDGKVCFLNKDKQIKTASDWNNSVFGKLWLYNLHYFDDLNAHGSLSRKAEQFLFIKRWISENPPMVGNGWEPYPTSLRLVNWIKWYNRSEVAETIIVDSVVAQTEALSRQLEFHILGNHLFANAKALVFAGCFLQGALADRYFQLGLRILDREIPEQFLADGAHFELSPMYHATLLWDMCDLVCLVRECRAPELKARDELWREVISRGIVWLRSMVHPDGEISFFNDATFGIAPTLYQLEQYAENLGCSPSQLVSPSSEMRVINNTSSGYITVDINGTHRAVLDLAKIGPDYQPGHAHADTLSFELSLFGQRVLVNSGISQYGQDDERHHQRSTSAHNTLEVDSENSSEIWAGFRVARRAHPFNIDVSNSDTQVMVSGCHDGFQRLTGKVIHCRKWVFEKNRLVVTDHISGNFRSACGRLYFHPDVKLRIVEVNRIKVTLPQGQDVIFFFEGVKELKIEESMWHPGFGLDRENRNICVYLSSNILTTHIGWGSH